MLGSIQNQYEGAQVCRIFYIILLLIKIWVNLQQCCDKGEGEIRVV